MTHALTTGEDEDRDDDVRNRENAAEAERTAAAAARNAGLTTATLSSAFKNL